MRKTLIQSLMILIKISHPYLSNDVLTTLKIASDLLTAKEMELVALNAFTEDLLVQ